MIWVILMFFIGLALGLFFPTGIGILILGGMIFMFYRLQKVSVPDQHPPEEPE